MKYFITGATGFIGQKLTQKLLNEGATVHALVRSPEKAKNILHDNLHLFKGNVTDTNAIETAMKDCDFAFHLAGYAQPWSKDENLPYLINVEGTRNVLDVAFQHKIKRVVFTSTAGTIKPSDNEEETDENSPEPTSYLTSYEETKKQAERVCGEYVKKGLDIVIVNPTRVYGSGLLSKSNSVTTIIKKYSEGKWHFLPETGNEIGNYVFVDDVVTGHILALKKGKCGERYLLGGENASFNHFFEILSIATEHKLWLLHLPLWLMLTVAYIMQFMANGFGIAPLITPNWVKRYKQNRVISSKKAENNIDYKITPLKKGVQETLFWLKK